jgi:hypothetical protein
MAPYETVDPWIPPMKTRTTKETSLSREAFD